MLCAPLHTAKDVRRGMRAWRDFMIDAPDEFTSDFVLWSVPADPHFPEEAWGKNIFIPAGVYCGEPAAGEQFIQPLRRLGEPILDLSRPVTYHQAQTGFDPFFRKGEFLHYWKALYLDELSDEAIEVIVDCYEQRPSPRTLISIRYHAGAVRRVEATATAFGDRSAQVLVSLDATWNTAPKIPRKTLLGRVTPGLPCSHTRRAGHTSTSPASWKRAMNWCAQPSAPTMSVWWR